MKKDREDLDSIVLRKKDLSRSELLYRRSIIWNKAIIEFEDNITYKTAIEENYFDLAEKLCGDYADRQEDLYKLDEHKLYNPYAFSFVVKLYECGVFDENR